MKRNLPLLFDGDFIEVRTVLPERTFWEKATILHHEANRPKELAIPRRYARHYYDLVCIANSPYKDRAFKSHELLEKVVQFKQKFYPRKWAKYEESHKIKSNNAPKIIQYLVQNTERESKIFRSFLLKTGRKIYME